MSSHLTIVVAIATAGRSYVLFETLSELKKQQRQPDRICICPATGHDVDRASVDTLDLPIFYSYGRPGASAQRNAILRDIGHADIVMFLDDDFVMAPDYLMELEKLFQDQPDVVLATGALIADDVSGRGLLIEEARALVEEHIAPATPATNDVFNGYGCNMAVRWSKASLIGAQFDERLPLYSWAEDVDFSRQVAKLGRIIRSDALRGVHRAVKVGRNKGVKFGYSQIANQLYLFQKGTISARLAIEYAGRNLLANMWRSFRPEPFVDRRGRLFGNLLGLIDVALGRSRPERILDL